MRTPLENPEVIPPGAAADKNNDADIRFAEWLAHALDGLYLDPIIGFVLPGVGDVIGSLLGLVIVVIAARRGMPRVVVARMLLNLGVDGLIGAVPIAGDVFDVVHRAHLKNAALLRERSDAQAKPGDWLMVVGAACVFGAALLAPLVLVGWLVSLLFSHS